MVRHVIVGAGPAAINAIETIREFDGGAAEIVLVSDEPAYSRMVLPYYLADQIAYQHIFTGDAAYFDRLKVQTRFGRRVVRVQPSAQRITLDNGEELAFDTLLLATGSSPTVPKIPGADLPGVYPLWTLAHTEAVLQAAAGRPKPTAVLVGAGFIGFIVLNAMYKRGWVLHVVEREPQVLPRMLDRESARLVENWLQQKGVTLHLGTTVSEIQPLFPPDGSRVPRKQLRLANGQALEADIVILATGIRANIDFLAGSGIVVDQGILVNDRMQTNFPNIYAAGDVAQGPDLLGGPPAIHAIQPTAVDHGRVAGANMAGHTVRYPGSLLMNILDVCGLQCASFGRWHDPQAEAMTLHNPQAPIYRRLLWTGDCITGAIFVGRAQDVGLLNDLGMVKGIIQTQTSLKEWKKFLHDNPFDIRRAYVGAGVAAQLAKTTLLGRPTQPRRFRYLSQQPQPQITHPAAHQAYVQSRVPQ
ncbi:MAG: FAD-dependent oxidoreductase [Gemmatales bacterium]|nr:FAD-dependent oxidoreductase [Gemmatales bacterium]